MYFLQNFDQNSGFLTISETSQKGVDVADREKLGFPVFGTPKCYFQRVGASKMCIFSQLSRIL